MHFFPLKKQTNPLFEDEKHNKITFKRQDFRSANVFTNLKVAFNSVGARGVFRGGHCAMPLFGSPGLQNCIEK